MVLVVSLQLHLLRSQFLGEETGEPGVMSVSGAHFEAGGDGVVAARTLRDLGHEPHLLSVRGGTTGEILERELAREGLAPELVPGIIPTPMGFRLFGARRNEVEEYREDPIRFGGEEMRELLERFDERLPQSRAVLLCGDSPSTGSEFLFGEMLRRLRDAGVPHVVKTRGPSLAECLRSGGDVIVVRRPQWIAAAREQGCSEETMLEQAFAAGSAAVVLTDGATRVSLWTEEGELELEPPATQGRGGLAPGEALAAGLLDRRLRGWDLQPSVCFGIAAGTAQSLKPLGGRLSTETIDGFYRQVRAVSREEAGE
ncbi:MAG: PfkB family carbohydrate kinase [Planctomycetota bacterium]